MTPQGPGAGLGHGRRPRPQGHREAGRRPGRCRASWWRCCPRSGCSARPMLHLLAAGNTVAEPWPVIFAESASYAPLHRQGRPEGDELPALERAHHRGHPALLTTASPCCAWSRAARPPQAGVQVGEIVDRRGRKARDADGGPPGRGGGQEAQGQARPAPEGAARAPRTVELTLGQTPQEIPLFDPDPALQQGHDGPPRAGGGLPGHGAGGLRRPQPRPRRHALPGLRGRPRLPDEAPRRSCPRGRGCPRARPSTIWGWPWSKLNYKSQAVEAYRPAAGFKDATLINNDGPAVAPLAARRGGS